MGDRESDRTGLGGQARALKEEFSPERIELELERTASERPVLRYLVSFDVVVRALVAAAVVTVLVLLVASPRMAALALVLVFFGTWFGLARVRYDRRRETLDRREPDPA